MSEATLDIPVSKTKPAVRKLFTFLSFSALLLWPVIWFGQHADMESLFGKVKAFRLKEVVVQSEWPVLPASVKTNLKDFDGKSLLVINPRKVSESLLKMPWVKDVSIKKQYPDELLVEVETKRARAIGLFRGQSFFLDEEGDTIDRVTNSMLEALDLPFISFRNETELKEWPFSDVLATFEELKKVLGNEFKISEMYLGIYPYFRIFLVRPRLEIIFSLENWQEQKENLVALLHHPPSQLGQLHKINLIFPKKAVVSSLLSN